MLQYSHHNPTFPHFFQLKDDKFDWSQQSGATTSFRTGPPNDHTLGTASGSYMYTEVSLVQKGWTARLQSPTFKYRNTDKCMTLWYHMFGTNIGKLEVLLKVAGSPQKTLWSASGE